MGKNLKHNKILNPKSFFTTWYKILFTFEKVNFTDIYILFTTFHIVILCIFSFMCIVLLLEPNKAIVILCETLLLYSLIKLTLKIVLMNIDFTSSQYSIIKDIYKLYDNQNTPPKNEIDFLNCIINKSKEWDLILNYEIDMPQTFKLGCLNKIQNNLNIIFEKPRIQFSINDEVKLKYKDIIDDCSLFILKCEKINTINRTINLSENIPKLDFIVSENLEVNINKMKNNLLYILIKDEFDEQTLNDFRLFIQNIHQVALNKVSC